MKAEEISFNLISLAGESFSLMMEALDYSLDGEIEKRDELMKKSEQLMNKAHNFQTKLIVKEAQGEQNELSVLLIHAQDTLMNTILTATLVKKMFKMNERITQLEGEK